MPLQRLAVTFVLLISGANAQWLNYSAPGIPRLPNGKPNLAAPAPRSADGHPDLSGVWMHETTTVEEVKRIFGHRWDDEIAGSIPGMEIGTQHKYGLDILADFKPPESAMRPEAVELYRKRMAARFRKNMSFRLLWATRWGIGKVTSSSQKPPVSTIRPLSIGRVTFIATPCASPSVFIAETSETSKSK